MLPRLTPVTPRITEALENCAADNGADNPQQDVANQAFAGAIDNLAAEETRDQADYQP